ncbi:hypothetical protein LSUB1_G002336, partial [Lachnellula subtilissima]
TQTTAYTSTFTSPNLCIDLAQPSMSSFARSIARTRLQAPQLRQFRQLGTETMVSTKTSDRAKPDWGYQAKRAGGTAMMQVCSCGCGCYVLALHCQACHGSGSVVDVRLLFPGR